MRLLLKLFAAPVMLALTILAAMLMFLFDICSFLLTVASVITALLGIGLFFTPTPHGGFIFLFLAFLLSPYGLQAAGQFPPPVPRKLILLRATLARGQ